MIIIATHAVFLNGKDIYGPPHAVSLYLNRKKIDHIFIKHRLDSDGSTLIEYYKSGVLVNRIDRGPAKSLPSFLHYFYELFITSSIILSEGKYCEVFIGVDPLNAFAGNLLKRAGRIRKTVFFSADFAKKRFENPLLNSIYLWLDKKAMFWSDTTWSISRRIVGYRQGQGLAVKKNKLLPNAPFFDSVRRLDIDKISKNTLVIVARLTQGIAFNLLFEAIADLRKEFSDIQLLVIGAGPQAHKLRSYVRKLKLQNHIKFLGALSHEKMFKVLVKSTLGIAFYENADPDHYHYFSDSMKVRDYLASGLPALISGNSGIIEEIEKQQAGKYVNLDKKSIVKEIREILINKKYYAKMRKNAIDLAEKYDTYKLLDKYFVDLKI